MVKKYVWTHKLDLFTARHLSFISIYMLECLRLVVWCVTTTPCEFILQFGRLRNGCKWRLNLGCSKCHRSLRASKVLNALHCLTKSAYTIPRTSFRLLHICHSVAQFLHSACQRTPARLVSVIDDHCPIIKSSP